MTATDAYLVIASLDVANGSTYLRKPIAPRSLRCKVSSYVVFFPELT